MSAFVWFTNRSTRTNDTVKFYADLLGWAPAPEGPPGMTLFASPDGPFAGVEASDQASWLPFAKVDDVDKATQRATELGAQVITPKTQGPAGYYSVLRDPGGATVALWQQA